MAEVVGNRIIIIPREWDMYDWKPWIKARRIKHRKTWAPREELSISMIGDMEPVPGTTWNMPWEEQFRKRFAFRISHGNTGLLKRKI